VRIAGLDLRLFEFDYDLTWYCFFLNADEAVYGRYGGRDASDPDARISLKGLRYAMERALEAHRSPPRPEPRAGRPVRAEDYPAAKRLRGGCIHCHNINEFRRADLQARGLWDRDEVWAYPLPENVGLTLDVDAGDRVKAVLPGSPAAEAGLRPGDRLRALAGRPVASFADASYALHKAPAAGPVPVAWIRDGREHAAELRVAPGWRKTNVTWRPSLLDILPALPFSGDDLTADEKKALGLPPGRAAFRQDKFVHSTLKAAGVRQGDVVIGFDGQAVDGEMADLLGHVRRNYLVGDKVTVNLLRDGKPVDVELVLK
jgi:membrane-associated protease RseP (regulator of RpoE activity)